MNPLIYIFRFIYRFRYWLIICPLLAAFVVATYSKKRMGHTYRVTSTIYTGVVSGYNIESGDNERPDWNIINNAMDNLMNIITAKTTLKDVSMRLFAQHLMYGNPDTNNVYLTAQTYRILRSKTPDDVLALIDKSSEKKTLENLNRYEKSSLNNHVYGLFNYVHRHYSYEALSQIKVRRQGNSDMIEVEYVADDPGVAYNTLVLLNEEFVKQYKDLRFGETNNVIKYFEQALDSIGNRLRMVEDSLTSYNVEKKVINYDEQTKHIAALSRDFQLKYESILLENKSAERMLDTLERHLDEHVRSLKDNTLFLQKLNDISDLTTKMTMIETFRSGGEADADPLAASVDTLIDANARQLQKQLGQTENEMMDLIRDIGARQYSKEGISSLSLVGQWLDGIISRTKTRAQLKVMQDRELKLDSQYIYFSPIGSTIKRKEREINFTEQSYLTTLHSLNAARLRQKSLQMTSATLKIINPPTFPISAMPTKRKLMTLMAFFGTIVFILGYFILLELLDRTLRDPVRTGRITGGNVLGAFPQPGRFRFRSYNKAQRKIAAQYMGNAVLNYFRAGKPDIINILSTRNGDGKTFLATELKQYLESIGLNVRYLNWETDFDIRHKDFLLAGQLTDFIAAGDEEVILVEYPPLEICPVPRTLMQEAALNLMVARANRVWRDTDQLLFEKAIEQSGNTPLTLYLNRASREVVESYTGMLPPYTYLRRLFYRLYQFGFTSGDR